MYKGQAIIYPSMYSLNILLYNKDYKTSNIHRWLSCVDSLLRYWLHWLSRTHWGKDTQRPCFLCKLGGSSGVSSCHSWEVEIASHPSVTGWTAIPTWYPCSFLFSEYWRHFFFHVLFVRLVFLSQPNSSFKTMETKFQFPFGALCAVMSCRCSFHANMF